MKTWAFGAVAISAFALMACGNGSSTTNGVGGASTSTGTGTATGGHTTVSVSHSSSGSMSTSTSTSTSAASSGAGGMAAGTCMAPQSGSDCLDTTLCPDRASCFACESALHQPGVMKYNTLVTCVNCDACFTTCNGAMSVGMMGGCMGPPAMKDACDVGAVGSATCQTCVQCSLGATCKADITACKADADCNGLLGDLPKCPKM